MSILGKLFGKKSQTSETPSPSSKPYWVNHLMGDSEALDLVTLPSLYDELSASNEEHPDVSLTHESEWSLAAFKSGLLVWENVAGEGDPKHMQSVSKEKVIELWEKLASGRIEEIEQEPWQEGYGR